MNRFEHYTLLDSQPVEEYRSIGYHLRHNQSGAEIFVLQNDDEENFFCFGFRTPSQDNRGLAHILEHSVLAGSKRYPIKDPFLTLLRSSMQTFLNAMTYPDKTLYPAASPVKQDFFNLFDVYGDAVFFPLIKKETFWQEGYRLIYNQENDTLEHGGVVYNEMKGAYSSIESYAFDAVAQSLHPTTAYRYDSGGNPDHIPSITHQMLVDFHQQYYHPNNAKIFLYGNIALEEKLDRLHQQFLQHFTNTKPSQSQIAPERAFTQRMYEHREFPSRNAEDDTNYISLNWLTAPLTDQETILSLEVLNHILFGSSGAPLYVALQTSGLGQDLSPVCGFSFDFNRAIFSAGLRGVKKEDQLRFEQLVDKSLAEIVSKGITANSIESALRAVEMQRRELRSGSFGLRLMSRLYKGWNYDLNPFEAILFEQSMAKLRAKAFTQGYFEQLIELYLIDNKHSSLTLITPNAALAKERDQAIQDDLQQRGQHMSQADKQQLLTQASELAAYQNTQDDPAVMPRLKRADIPTKVKDIATQEQLLLGRPLYSIDNFTNGLYHWNVAFDLSDLSEEDLKWLPLFCRAMGGMGSDKLSYVEMSQAIARDSGGFNFILDTGDHLDSQGQAVKRSAMLHLNFKALNSQIHDLPKTLEQALFHINFADSERLQALYWELYNEMMAAVVPSGSGVASLRLSRLFSPSAYTEELWHGVEQLRFLELIQDRWQQLDFAVQVASRFKELHRRIFIRERAYFGMAGPNSGVAAKTLEKLFQSLASESWQDATANLPLPAPAHEMITTNTQVNFVALALKAHNFNDPMRAAEVLLGQFLTVGELWHAIRMQGGAYGVSASATGSAQGIFTFTSYRDPHIQRTLEVFKDTLRNFKGILASELEDTLIARVGKENRPQGPQEALSLAMKRKIYNIPVALRQKVRDQLMAVDTHLVQQAAKELAAQLEHAVVAIITNQEQAQQQAAALSVTQITKLMK